MNFWLILRIGGAVVGIIFDKLPKAMADGKITVQEAFDILLSIANIAGIPIEFDVPVPNETAGVKGSLNNLM